MNDLISRQAALYAIYGICNDPVAWLIRAASEIEKLPPAQPEPCEYAVSATAVEEMLKDLLPERGMWEIEGDECKTAICETVRDALEGLWKLPFVKPNSIESSLTQKALDTISGVSCKDCKWYNDKERTCNDLMGFGRHWKPDDFCSYRKRRTDE